MWSLFTFHVIPENREEIVTLEAPISQIYLADCLADCWSFWPTPSRGEGTATSCLERVRQKFSYPRNQRHKVLCCSFSCCRAWRLIDIEIRASRMYNWCCKYAACFRSTGLRNDFIVSPLVDYSSDKHCPPLQQVSNLLLRFRVKLFDNTNELHSFNRSFLTGPCNWPYTSIIMEEERTIKRVIIWGRRLSDYGRCTNGGVSPAMSPSYH